jgi:hypothetical protein
LIPRLLLGIGVEINDEVKAKMLEYLQQLEAGVKSAADFSAEQAPLVVQEFLLWILISNAVAASFLGSLVLATLILSVVMYRRSDSEERFFIWLFAAIPLTVFSAGCCASLHEAGKAYIAPRVVVLEKISSLME